MKKRSGGILAAVLAVSLFISYGIYNVFVPVTAPPPPLSAAAEFFAPRAETLLLRRGAAKRIYLHRRLKGLEVLFSSSSFSSSSSGERRRNGRLSGKGKVSNKAQDGIRGNEEIAIGSQGNGKISNISQAGLPGNEEIAIRSPNGEIKTEAHENGEIAVGYGGNEVIRNVSLGNGPRMTWAHMRELLLRSDALPETATSVREAAAAWKDLLSTREEGGLPEEHRGCPVSIIGNITGGRLSVPCGLVQDSAITVVAVPTAKQGGFVVDLEGSDHSGNGSDIILRYRVGFGVGDEGPWISQNSWTAKRGWGAEERCPSLSSVANVTVDGLSLCSEPQRRSLHNSSSNGHGGQSNGSSSIGANFPFVEGHPFTATLWAGLRGFHMTVNGLHETSFLFRKDREPWLVKGARVSGDVDLLSLLASRLPRPENDDFLIDVDKLRAPGRKEREPLLLVGVFSSGNNFNQRMAMRRSWMQYSAVRSGEVAVRFFAGLDKTRQVNIALLKEAQTYGDIQLMPFVDYYSLLTLKTIAICIFGTKVMPAKYIMKTDDDAFVRIDEMASILRSRKASNLLYGRIAFDSNPHRDQESKWYINEKEWPDDTYPPWAYGPGYIVSQDIAKFIVKGHQDLSLQLFKLEDVAVGIWIDQFKSLGGQVDYVNDDRFYNSGCDDGYVLAHYQSPRLLLCLWQKLLDRPDSSGESTCCDY